MMVNCSMEKKGILIISFGTSYRDTEMKCIIPIEDAVKVIFKDFEVRRAFTSKMIIKKLAKQGQTIPTPEEAVKKMAKDGFTHVIVQPLHFMKGHEFNKKIVAPLLPYKDTFEGFAIGEPLLSGDSDFDQVAGVIGDMAGSLNGEKLLLMGHGSDHPSDDVYSILQKKLDEAGIDASIATVEGSITLTDVLPDLLETEPSRVHLFPLMLVAGDHARNDMAGDEGSWKKVLEAKGVNALPHLQGMGEYMKIRKIFINHIRVCKRELFPEKYRKMREAAEAKKINAPREEIPWFPTIDAAACSGCGLCFIFCHRRVYAFDEMAKAASVDFPYKCVVNCSYCVRLCPGGAISFPAQKIDLEFYNRVE